MKIDDFREQCSTNLAALYPQEEIDAIFFELLLHYENITRIAYATKRDLVLKKEQQLRAALSRLVNHEPLQYITEKAFFMDLTLDVSPQVLIPRPETEELVQLVLRENGQQVLRVLDVGTGSGCIALALKKHKPNWTVVGVDRSAEALSVAHNNAANTGLAVHFKLADMCAMPNLGIFDIIISNPPYIPAEREAELAPNVRLHEPKMALFAPETKPLHFYSCILAFAAKNLAKKGGRIYFETHFDAAQQVADLAPKKSEKRILVDMFGKERFVAITL